MKHVLLVLAALSINLSLFAQTLHLQAGPSFSKLDWKNSLVDEEMFKSNVTGLNVMLGAEYLNFKYFVLSSNLGFIQKGGKDSIDVADAQGNLESKQLFKIKINYLTLNTCAEFRIPIKEIFIPYIFAGPRVDYLVSYKEDAAFLKEFDDANKLNKFIYGLLLGAGVNLQINKIQLGVLFSYYLDANSLVNYSTENNTTNKITENAFTLNFQVGYRL